MRVWKEIQAETGFASCADYLEFYKDVRPDFKDQLKQYRKLPEDLVTAEKKLAVATNLTELPPNQRTSIVIYDLSKQENLPVSLSLRCHCHSGTELIQAVCEPPGNVCVQIVLWSFYYRPLSQEMADTLVLGLKLDPQSLEDVNNMERVYDYPRKGFWSSHVKRVGGNGAIATLSQIFMPEVAKVIPVPLLASETFNEDQERTFEELLSGGDQGKPPVHRSALENKSFGEMESDGQKRRGQLYARTGESFVVQGRTATPSKAFLLLAATSPLLYMEAYRVREASNNVRGRYKALTDYKMKGRVTFDTEGKYIGKGKDLDKDLDKQRLGLRRTLEEAEDHVSQIFKYLGSEVDLDWSKDPSYVSINADWRSLIDEAHRLEAEFRDYMQLQVGNLSLEESRTSIELSNIQIRESKSVKICQYKMTYSNDEKY